MKKFHLLVLFLPLLFAACPDPTEGTEPPSAENTPLFCDMQSGVISESDYNHLMILRPSTPDYWDILNIKNRAISMSIDSYGTTIEYNVPESEIRSLLNGKMTTAEIEMAINSLKVGGNIILFFTLNDGTSNVLWLYLAAVR